MTPYLLVANAFTPAGGMERANHALALYLARRGGHVHLVGHGASADVLAFENVRFHRAPRPLGADLLGMPLVDWIGRFWARRIARIHGRVIVNGGNCLWGDVNWVHYVHAAWGSGWKRRWFMRDERRALRRARLIVSNSDRTTADLVERLGVDEKRVRTLFLGVDAERFCPPGAGEREAFRREMGWRPDEKVVAFVGAASDRRKGLDRLMAAWRKLEGEKDWRLVTVGANGPEAGERIQWLGFRPDIEKVLAGCDLVAAPSRYESYGLGVPEALCLGTPAMVAKAAGVAEQYSETLRPLLLEDVEDAGEIARRLLHWAANRDSYRAATLALSSALRRRDWNVMAKEFIDLVEERRTADRSMIQQEAPAGSEFGLRGRRLLESRIPQAPMQPSEADVL
jgi:glycosyltransferase involved in cell wall biosynthesis